MTFKQQTALQDKDYLLTLNGQQVHQILACVNSSSFFFKENLKNALVEQVSDLYDNIIEDD